MNSASDDLAEMTLDPPGRIAVVGAGPLGLEAALYGRFLGYEVTVYERGDIGQSVQAIREMPLAMLPDRCLSPLAKSAIAAQDSRWPGGGSAVLPTTIGRWIDDGLQRIAATDLMRGRIQLGCEVIAIKLQELEPEDVELEVDDEYFIDGEVPDDFCLTLRDGETEIEADCEAVIIAIGPQSPDAIAGYSALASAPYLFRIGGRAECDDEQNLLAGWHEIVAIYARLGGRSTLDLYRPRRS